MTADADTSTERGDGASAAPLADGSEVNSPTSRHSALLRNFGMLMMSQVTTWAISLAGVVVIPRYLGAELVGRLHIANSVWAIGFVVAVFGVDMMITKEVARDPHRSGALLGSSIAVRLLMFAPVAAFLFAYARLAGYPDQTLVLFAIVGVGMVVAALASSMSAVLQGLERMGMLAMANVAARVVSIGGAVVLLVLGQGVYTVAAFVGVGHAVALVLLARALRDARREVGDTSPIRISARSGMEVLRAGAPYFAVAFFISLYLQIDAVVISLVVESDEVLGWYSAYDRLGGTLMFLPTVFITAAYPTFSRMYAQDAGGSARLARRCFESMLLLSVPIGFGLAAVADPLVELLFGSDFAEAGSVVAVGGIVTCLTYLTTVLGMLLISMDRQKQWTRFIALGALLTIPLDIVLVPYFQDNFDNGAIGGAVAYLVTETVMLAGAIYLLPRGALGIGSLGYALRAVAAGLAMVAVVVPLSSLPLVVPIAAGGVVYAVMAVVLRLVSADDRRLVRSVLPGGSP